MAFETPTVEELRDRALRGLNAELPELRTGPGTLARIEAGTYARVTADVHARLDVLDLDATPDRASEAGLERWADVLGVERKAATGARKAQALEVRGTASSSIPEDTHLVHGSGLRYQISTALTIPASGVALADVEAIDTGPSTRLPAGESLRFTSPPTGVEQAARIMLDLDEGGEAAEPVGVWRERVLDRFRVGVQGGTRSDYEQWVLEATEAVRSAYVYPNKPTQGSVSIAGLRDGTGDARPLNSSEREEIADYLETLRPITDNVIVMQTPTERVHVDLQVSTLAGAGFDWDDTDGYTVNSYDAATRELVFSASVPPTLAAGHLLTIVSADPDTSGADGFPAVVSVIVDDTTVVLAPFEDRSQPLSWTPSNGDAIYASSATAVRVRNAVLGGYQVGCGTDAEVIPGINQLGPANPDAEYGDWQSDVTRPRLQAAGLSVAGVTEVTVVAPASDVEAEEFASPDDDQVQLLIPGQIVVRRA